MEAINLLKYHTTQKSSQILTTLGLTTFDINVYLHLEWIAIENICLHRLLFTFLLFIKLFIPCENELRQTLYMSFVLEFESRKV